MASPRNSESPDLDVVVGPGGCTRPQMLVDELSGAVVLTRCKATSVQLCAACARLYEGDAKRIVRSGVSQRLERDQVMTFLTLTGPPIW